MLPLDADRVADYLARVGCEPPVVADAAYLRALHRSHLQSVPFENLDIHLAVPIALDIDALYDKIVGRRRGGFCYELNGLFAALLQSLGYPVELLQSRVVGDGGVGIPFDHMRLRVLAPDPLLADVGFGASFIEPLRAVPGIEQNDATGTYVVEPTDDVDGSGDEWWSLWHDGVESDRFSLRPRELADFAAGCEYHQSSPDSHFTRNTVCSRPTSTGRRTLRGRTLVSTVDGETERRQLTGIDEMATVYRDDFGIELDDAQLATLWQTP